ncbi:MAG: hypothetical protein LC781_13075 [Actinobacteria bacterium]|nr:hypothetical protein [Actinomycetota bacterium]
MRRISPTVPPLVLFGVVLLLSLFGAGAGVISFFLLRAGYGFVVWGVLPFLALVLVALVLGAAVWRLAGGKLPGIGRSDNPEEKPRR